MLNNFLINLKEKYDRDHLRNNSLPQLSFECKESEKNKLYKAYEKDCKKLNKISNQILSFGFTIMTFLMLGSLLISPYLLLIVLLVNLLLFPIYAYMRDYKFQLKEIFFLPLLITEMFAVWSYIKWTEKKFIFEKQIGEEIIKVNANLQEYKYKKGKLHSESCEPAIKRKYSIEKRLEATTDKTISPYFGDYYYEGVKMDFDNIRSHYEEMKKAAKIKGNAQNF